MNAAHESPATHDDKRLPKALFELLAPIGQSRRHARGARLVSEGEAADSLYLVHRGELRVFVSDDNGREVELNRLGPGEYFGEMMLASPVRTASIQAVTAVETTQITRAAFERLVEREPALALHLLRHLIERVNILSRRVQSLISSNVQGRIVALFEAEAIERENRRLVRGQWTQQAIAERVGASKGMVNRILQDLVSGGFIQISRARIEILKPLPRR